MSSTEKKNYLLPIIMMIALFAMISFVTGLPNPMGVIVKNQFGASNFMSQLGNAANFIAYAFMGLPAGLLLQRIGYKKTALAAIVIGFTGVGVQYLSGLAGSFAVYLAGAFVSGFSMCMLNTVVNPMLNTLGSGGKKGNQLIQIGGTFNSLSATIVPVLVGYFIGNAVRPSIKDANPALFIAMGIFAIVFIVLLLMNIPEPHMVKEVKSKEKSKYSPLSFRHFILGAVAIFVYVGVEVGIPNISNLFMTTKTTEQFAAYEQEYMRQKNDQEYLVQIKAEADKAVAEAEAARVANAPDLKEKVELAKKADSKVISEEEYLKAKEVKIPGLGMDPVTAGSVVGTYWFLMLLGRLVVGASLGARISSKSMLSAASLAGLVFVLLAIFIPTSTTVSMPVFQSDISFGLAQVPISIMFLILCGLCTSIMWGGIFNLAVEGLGKFTAAASGIFMVMVCGGGVLPLIQGGIADSVSYMASFWVIFVGLAYLLFYALIGSKNVNTNIPVE
ncbi:MAG: MFS transporter [Prevotella sp.]|jgi:FHS family L-fucose permease-like MFS transporter|nr:MFS transporter [Prevotella sp.]